MHLFAKTPGQTLFVFSRSMENRLEYPVAYLNPYLGFLEYENLELNWEMVFTLTQLNSGQYRVGEILWSKDESVFIDEPQSYLLSKEKQ